MKILKKELSDVQLTIEDQDLRITDLESLKTEHFDPQCKRTSELEETLKELQVYILHQENRSRKYNLLFYGLPKIEHEQTTEIILLRKGSSHVTQRCSEYHHTELTQDP